MNEKKPAGIDRRELLKGAIALVGGATWLAGCGDAEIDAIDPAAGAGRYFDEDRLAVLARVVDIIMPATDTPGALAASVDRFIDGMMAGWASAATRVRYDATLDAIDARAFDAHGARFVDCAPHDQAALLRRLDRSAFGDDPEVPGFRELRFLVLAGYYTSEIGASQELRFELVPGRYLECVPVGDIGRAWAYR